MRVNDLWAWIRERHTIYLRRSSGIQKPWTSDPILQRFRFCNVYRELDTVTQWIRKEWREKHWEDRQLWFAMVVARIVNWPDSLADVGYPVPWDAKQFARRMDARKARGEKLFTGAYMIHADRFAGGTKAAYLAERVLTPIWERREEGNAVLRQQSLAAFHTWLMKFRDMGSFMAAQVVCDTKYTPLLSGAKDWMTWAAPGPGSLRGLNRVMGHDKAEPWKTDLWLATLQTLQVEINKKVRQKGWEPLHAQDLQNCLCEFDKWERVRLGEGKPRATYNGVA